MSSFLIFAIEIRYWTPRRVTKALAMGAPHVKYMAMARANLKSYEKRKK